MKYNKLYDISMPIMADMPVYKGKPEKRPVLKVQSNFQNSSVYESKLELNLHTGTHMDSTLHMMEGGATIDTIDLTEVVTSCKVLDLTEVKEKITKEDLMSKKIEQGDFILLKTRNSFEDILESDFVFLDKTGAKYLSSLQIKGIGIDALGIERSQPGHETHLTLMASRIHILEGLRLKEVEEGEYFLFAAPISIPGAEAAPVKAILLQ